MAPSHRERHELKTIVTAIAAFFALLTTGIPCPAEPTIQASLEVTRPLGDVYNERTTDGDAYPGSIGVRATVVREGYALTMDFWRNVYLTESGAANAQTRYARIEGGFGSAVPFLARESSFEGRLVRRIARRGPLFAGAGIVRTWTNYHYPSLTGIGAGVELRPYDAAGLRPFGSAFYYPSASGPYVTESAPARSLTPTFSILKLGAGFVLRGTRSPLYAVIGYASEARSGHALAGDVRLIRSDPYAAVGIRL